MDVQLAAALRIAATILPGTPVLEVGSGDGSLGIALTQLSIRYFGCEVERGAADAARSNIERSTKQEAVVVQLHENAIPFGDASFEWIFVPDWDNLENAVGSVSALSDELNRVLRTGGWIWVGFQADSSMARPETILHRSGFVDASAITTAQPGGASHRILRKVDAETPM